MKRYEGIVFIGPPGIGKGTQTRMLTKHGFGRVSTGDTLESLTPDSELGAKWLPIIGETKKKGAYFSDELALGFLRDILAQHSTEEKIFMEGYPRTPRQADLLEQYVDVKCVIQMHTDHPEMLIERIMERNERAYDRDVEANHKRQRDYEEKTKPVLDHYKGKVPVHRIDGTGTPTHRRSVEEVHREIVSVINRYFRYS